MDFEKKLKRKEKRAQKFVQQPNYETQRHAKPQLRAMNKTQQQYINSIRANVITFGIGPAGVGKTYIAASYAAELLEEKLIDSVILTRPNVEASSKGFGFLPGDLGEKFAPYMEPLLSVLEERLGKSYTDLLVKRGQIKLKPLEFMRGSTFKNSLCILDEAQNCTPSQMKLFLSRIGDDCKVIIDGDIAQTDIRGLSGLADAVDRLYDVDKIGIVEFGIDDIVRSEMCKEIILRYR
jgi:phosphate starvation-inducible protein PhoH and related proteins